MAIHFHLHSLSTKELEELVTHFIIDIDTASNDLLYFHAHALVILAKRFRLGHQDTIIDRWKEAKHIKKAKQLHDKLLEIEHDKNLDEIRHEIEAHQPPDHIATTDIFYTLTTWLTIGRLPMARLNKLLGVLKIPFLPAWFAIVGLSFGIELLFDAVVIIKATFFPTQAEKDNVGRARVRFNAIIAKDNRKTRMKNAAIWLGINLIGFILTTFFASLVLTIPVIGVALTVPVMIAGLTLAGMLADFYVDGDNAMEAIAYKKSLLEKMKETEGLEETRENLSYKVKEAFINRLGRMMNSDFIMISGAFLTSLFILFPVIAIPIGIAVGIGLVSLGMGTTAAEFLATGFGLKNTKDNTVDMIRLAVVFGILLTAALIIAFPPAGVALSTLIPLVGASIVFFVGMANLARRLYHADTQWVKDKWEGFKRWFTKKDPEPHGPEAAASQQVFMPKGKSEDTLPTKPAEVTDVDSPSVKRNDSFSYKESNIDTLFSKKAPAPSVDDVLEPEHTHTPS